MSLRNTKNTNRNRYIEGLYHHESEVQKFIKKSIIENNLPPINLSYNETKIIQFLIKTNGIKTIVEFGTHAGYSAASMAEALPENGKIFSFEKDKRTADIAISNFQKFGLDSKIQVIIGNAHETLNDISGFPNLKTALPVDMVFIDAEKQGYPNYLEWSCNNVRKGGLIIADNTFLFDAVFDEAEASRQNQKILSAMLEFNKNFADKHRFESIILPTDDGLSIGIKK